MPSHVTPPPRGTTAIMLPGYGMQLWNSGQVSGFVFTNFTASGGCWHPWACSIESGVGPLHTAHAPPTRRPVRWSRHACQLPDNIPDSLPALPGRFPEVLVVRNLWNQAGHICDSLPPPAGGMPVALHPPCTPQHATARLLHAP